KQSSVSAVRPYIESLDGLARCFELYHRSNQWNIGTKATQEVSMATLLKVQAGLFGEQSQSTQLADRFVARWRTAHPNGRVIVRDLNANPLPHLTAQRVQALDAGSEDRTPGPQSVANVSDALVEEPKKAVSVVLGVPMYKLGVPCTVRSCFDQIARRGGTFRYA